jgi:hypothetical protein
MKRLLAVVFALACTLTLARSAQAGTEFGVDDDLAVYGTDGTYGDPDFQAKGFSVFGETPGSSKLTSGQDGAVQIAGDLQVDQKVYFDETDTYVTNMAVDQNTRILVQDTSGGQLKWESLKNVLQGGSTGGVSDLHLPIYQTSTGKYVNSQITQNDFGLSSSETLISDNVNITKDVKIQQDLLVQGDTKLGEGSKSVGINLDPSATTALSVKANSTNKTVAEFFTSGGARIAFFAEKP